MQKAVIKIFRILLVGHLAPVAIFGLTIFMASAVVTACSPSRGSTLKTTGPSAAQANLKSDPSSPSTPLPTDLEKDLSGTWLCVTPKDAATPCFGQSLVFSSLLDKIAENTFISLEDSKGKCHVEINYTLSALTDKDGNVILQLGSAILGDLIKDPSNADECESDFQNSPVPNLSRHQALSHTADWKQITLDGVTYSRPDPTSADPAEAWPAP